MINIISRNNGFVKDKTAVFTLVRLRCAFSVGFALLLLLIFCVPSLLAMRHFNLS